MTGCSGHPPCRVLQYDYGFLLQFPLLFLLLFFFFSKKSYCKAGRPMQLSALPAHLNSTQELNARGAFFFFFFSSCAENFYYS